MLFHLLLTADTAIDPLAQWSTLLSNLGVAGLMIALILAGRLWPKSSVDEIKALQEARIEQLKIDRDAWRSAFELLRDKEQGQLERDAVLLRLLEEIKAAGLEARRQS